MKYLATIVCVGILGVAQAQSTEKEIEMYERYENGELVEERKSATENGKTIDNFDFEEFKREIQLKSAKLEEKFKEMESRMAVTRDKMEASMKERMQGMEQRLTDFEKKSKQMHKKMDQKMKDMDAKRKSEEDSHMEETPVPTEKPTMGESSENIKFT